MRAFAFIHGVQARPIRDASGVLVAEEFHVTAERNGRDFPPRAVAIVKTDQFGAKTDRKHQYPHPAKARDQEMAKLVDEHDKAENEQKGDKIGDDASPKRM